jgi:two-component system copper resistance phosphate regulon response regulator CusR
MRVLLIEDEHKTASYLKKGLSEAGYIVDCEYNGTDGLYTATTFNYDLMILDVMLPYLNGFQIIQRFREENKATPIIILSARDTVEDRIKGLELGADDYLIKPFSFSELLARINSLLRRSQVIQQPLLIKIADLEINLREHKATRSNQRIFLTPKEFALLALLAKRQGELLTRSVITEHVWEMNFNCDTNVVDVMIKRLRSKIDFPFTSQLIHTVRGVGYVLEER